MPHRISIHADYRSGTNNYTYHFKCTCGAYNFGSKSRGAAEAAGRKHQEKEGAR